MYDDNDDDVLESLDDFDDDSYGAYLDYIYMLEECEFQPTKLLISSSHPYYHEMKTFAQADNLQVISTTGVTKIC